MGVGVPHRSAMSREAKSHENDPDLPGPIIRRSAHPAEA